MKKLNIISFILLSFFLLMNKPVLANKDALAKAQFMLRQMNAELNQLKATNQKLLAEKKQLENDKQSLQKKHDKLSNKSKKSKAAMSGRIADIKQQYKDEVSGNKEIRNQLQEITKEKNRLFDIANRQAKSMSLCVSNNLKLYELNQNALEKYESKGIWDSLTQAESFSGLSQVEIENLVDDYQYKLDDLRIESEL